MVIHGKTKRRLKDRVLEHLACISRKDMSSAIAAHILDEHGANENFVSFQVKENVRMGKRKGDFDKVLSEREIKWMSTLETVIPQGLNNECDIKYYID
ncbi:hypothetical protein XELAEV_18041880mg [Xenopus laevis]|uniref:Uncharacterized protein n=1 Tax=Xenopus laevis TaxID=8355 RepID=A0A974C2Y5_XENLA|nr:hypothetical protein XELAEV_18041880mg [Xenopus laevis]